MFLNTSRYEHNYFRCLCVCSVGLASTLCLLQAHFTLLCVNKFVINSTFHILGLNAELLNSTMCEQ